MLWIRGELRAAVVSLRPATGRQETIPAHDSTFLHFCLDTD